MLQDWQLYKENPVPNQDLFDKKLHNIGIHFNLAREICTSRLFFPAPSPTITMTNTTMPTSTTIFTSIKTTPALILFTSTSTLTLCMSTSTITTPISTISVLPITTSSLTPTTSTSISQRPKVAFVEDDEESDSELSFYDRFLGVSEVPALPVSGVFILSDSGVLFLPDMEKLSKAKLKKQQLNE